MNRALFSGVSGLKAHQTKMDVIGNNIANVNTYGYKSQRVIFSDLMYQTLTSASQGTSSAGGTNPSTVGYGSSAAAIQTNTSQASMQNTSYGTDVAICGEGFYQVMDSSGNIYYTKAGIFGIDEQGYLVDVNGSFVLGSNGADGDPDSQKIQVNNVGTVTPKKATKTFKLNDIEYSLTADKSSDAGNVSFTFAASDSLADGLAAKATISSTGAITITFNKNETFSSLDEVNNAINAAITEANNGQAHAAGNFTLAVETDDTDPFANGALTGADLVENNFGVDSGVYKAGDDPDSGPFGVKGLNIESFSSQFSSAGDITWTGTRTEATATDPEQWELIATIDGKNYKATVTTETTGSTILFKRDGKADTDDYFEMTTPTVSKLNASVTDPNTGDIGKSINVTYGKVTASTPSKDMGLGSAAITLSGGTEGGEVTLSELSISISSNGTVYATQSELGTIAVGAISLANFANPSGLEQAGTNYFSATVNSGDPELCTPGKDGTGNLKTSALEMSNVDLSSEMADMITTQRGFQANSRIITVTDTMLEELINLKR